MTQPDESRGMPPAAPSPAFAKWENEGGAITAKPRPPHGLARPARGIGMPPVSDFRSIKFLAAALTASRDLSVTVRIRMTAAAARV